LPISANGDFEFDTAVPDGSDYAVTVKTQPSNSDQVCSVNKGNGTVNGAEVSNIIVICSVDSYTVGGTVSGYEGNGLVLQNNGSDDLIINANGNFAFGNTVADGSDYVVTVKTQPSNPDQICTVENGSGTINGASVSNIIVTCLTITYAIGGTVSGYVGNGLVLQNNEDDELLISNNDDFAFATTLINGSEYAVTVKTQPSDPNQICTVGNGEGTVSGADVTNITVICKTTYTIGGTISGLTGSGLVLQNNGGDDLPISDNDNFEFDTAVLDGSDYAVTVQTQPSDPNQICIVGNGESTVSGALVTNITVTCEAGYTLGGTVSGLAGSGLVLQNNEGDDLSISENDNFEFDTAVLDGSDYAVTVHTRPSEPNQICTVDNGTGTVSGADVTNITVTCVASESYLIKVTVAGLADGDELVLQNNGSDDLLISDNGDFPFATTVPDSSAYSVTVLTPPESATQRCIVENSEGFLQGEDVNVTVNCQWLLFIRANDGTVGEELFATNGTTAGTSLVKNINTNANADPHNLVVAGGVAYFVATDSITGNELWKTDGTVAGTVLVKDIRPGASGASLSELTAVGDTLYFGADDGINRHRLWKSDGTEVGTMLVNAYYPNNLTAIGDTLYFNSGSTLWKSDGTTDGTKEVRRIYFGSNSNHIVSPKEFMAVGNMLYFTAYDGEASNWELWKSDGTPNGTKRIKSIPTGLSNVTPSRHLTAVGDMLYFIAYGDKTNNWDLWKSDGTGAGTVMVKNIRTGLSGATPPRHLTAVGNTLYFSAYYEVNGRELWKSDGTESGTAPIKDIRPGEDGASLNNFTAVGDTLYFSADDGINGNELWKSDGTDIGTEMVKDIQSGSSDTFPNTFTAVGNTLYFSANDGSNGRELWKSDGTEAGTELVKDIHLGEEDSVPDNFGVINGLVYFAAYDGINGRELWRSDGTDNGTYLLADIGEIENGSAPEQMIKIGGTSYFTAKDGTNRNRALWRSDGTADSTVLVKNIDIAASPLITIGNTFYFSADDGMTGYELWKSDGTEVGTVRVKDIWPGSASASLRNFVTMGNTLYFIADDGDSGDELWRSDGTEVGTVQVKDIQSGVFGASLSQLTAVGDTLYFSSYRRVLWKSDGTDIGTEQVMTTIYGIFSNFTAVNNTLYFTERGRLWKSDGTDIGAERVGDISSVSNLIAVGNMLYFARSSSGSGRELWKSDGTKDGTVLVKDIRSGAGSNPRDFTVVGNTLYFSADDGVNSRELWKSDGTEVGTVLVRDINLVKGDSATPDHLMAVGNMLYFSADNGASGRELWKSDGTEAGTEMLNLNSNFEKGSDPVPLSVLVPSNMN